MIVVTGGAGYIGSNIVKGLNDRGHTNILVVDDLTNGEKHKNLNRLKFADYIDYRDLLANIGKMSVKVISHQGACSDTTERDGRFMMSVNYDYSKKLLEYSLAHSNVQFIYASSASVYGDGKKGFTEKPECEYPLNVYAYSKFQFDNYVRNTRNDTQTQIVGLRYFNVYGPQENHKGKMASVAFHSFNNVKSGNPMRLFEGSENIKRDFIHVDDVVKVNLFFIENPHLSGIYNCGTGRAESFMNIATAVREVYPEAKLDIIPFPEELKGKYQTFTQADMSKLHEAGYKGGFMTVNEGVKRYLKVLEEAGGYII
jgi:ADP-L-glycero-D-manno-heptose 6-epimerase